MITRESLEARIVVLKNSQEQAKQQFIAISGQIAEIEFQLAEDLKAESEPASEGIKDA